MFKLTQSSDFARRTLALTALLGASVAVMGAQTAAPAAASTDNQPVLQGAQAGTSAEPAYSSSADTVTPGATEELATNADHFNFVNAMQYGGGGNYGRPRYRGGNTNPDGSSKWMGFGGGGFGVPVADTSNYLTIGWGLQVGFGRQWSNHFAVPIEFDYDHFGFTQNTLNNQTAIYNSPNVFGPGAVSELGGTSHVWSFSLDPTWTLTGGGSGGLGAYVVGDVGFFHKTANFTIPATGSYCDPFYGCYEYQANETIDKYTSNAPGFGGGLGVTYKFSKFSGERLYGEVRYVYVVNSPRAGIVNTPASLATINANTTNLYPANSNRTSYIPVKFGIRF